MGLSWARLTLPLRKERQCYDLRFQRALANLRRTSNTEASKRSLEDRIHEARRTLPCNRYKQLREGESAFWALLPILKTAGLTSADFLPCESTAHRCRLLLPAYGHPARRAQAQAWLDMLRLSDSSDILRRKGMAAQQVLRSDLLQKGPNNVCCTGHPGVLRGGRRCQTRVQDSSGSMHPGQDTGSSLHERCRAARLADQRP